MPPSKKICNRNHTGQVFNNLLESNIGQVFNKLFEHDAESNEFALPEWLNKEKPTPYTYIKRNIYLTNKNKRRAEDDGIFCSCASLPGFSEAVCGSDCHCGMLYSSCSSSCKCGSECNNKPFQQRRVKKLKLTQTENCGSGIVAEEEIKEGEFIIEYVGEVIDDATCEERLWKMKDSGETNFYLCEISRNMVIDATNKGNKSRYINHSCNPNTQMQKWITEGETRLGIFATCDIDKGEHLTYDYQFVQFGPDQDCHCGAEGCRKKLGVKPNKPKSDSDEALNIVASEVAKTLPKKLGVKPSKPKVASDEALNIVVSEVEKTLPKKVGLKPSQPTLASEEALNIVASEVAKTLPQVHQNGGIHNEGTSRNKLSEEQTCPRNCIGVVIRLSRPTSNRCLGIIRRVSEFTGKHMVMFEDGVTEFIDLSKEDWEILSE